MYIYIYHLNLGTPHFGQAHLPDSSWPAIDHRLGHRLLKGQGGGIVLMDLMNGMLQAFPPGRSKGSSGSKMGHSYPTSKVASAMVWGTHISGKPLKSIHPQSPVWHCPDDHQPA